MGDQSKDRIAALRRELAELEAQERGDKIPTLAEIKDMSPEQIEIELQRLAKREGGDGSSDASAAGRRRRNAWRNGRHRARGRPGPHGRRLRGPRGGEGRWLVVSAREDLRELRERVEQAREVVAAAEREVGLAARRYEQARAALRGYHAAVAAGAPADVDHEQQLAAELAHVLSEVSVSYAGSQPTMRDESAEAQLAEAQRALEDAESAVDAFMWTRSEEVAEELVAMARDLAARYVPVAEDVQRLEREFHTMLGEWRAILEPLRISPRDLPESPATSSRFSQITPPMPIPLMHEDEMATGARATWQARQAAERAAVEREQISASLAEQRASEGASVR